MRYALKIKTNSDNAAYECLFDRDEDDETECLGTSIANLFIEADIDPNCIMLSKVLNQTKYHLS